MDGSERSCLASVSVCMKKQPEKWKRGIVIGNGFSGCFSCEIGLEARIICFTLELSVTPRKQPEKGKFNLKHCRECKQALKFASLYFLKSCMQNDSHWRHSSCVSH